MNRILVVEDDRHISELVKVNLSDAGYFCICAYDGQQVIDLLDHQSFDLIILDVMLPYISGFDLMEYF